MCTQSSIETNCSVLSQNEHLLNNQEVFSHKLIYFKCDMIIDYISDLMRLYHLFYWTDIQVLDDLISQQEV